MIELSAFGGIIADLSTGQSTQDFKYGDKQLDRTYGLDLYDFEARQYDAIVPMFSSIDPLAEKYYGISPYAYCAGDPVNLVDPTGGNIYYVDSTGYIFLVQECEDSRLWAANPNNNDGIIHIDLENDDLMEQLRVKDFEKGDGFTEKRGAKQNTHQAETSSNQALDVFNFLALNTSVEWGYSQDDTGNSYIGTYHLNTRTPVTGLSVAQNNITLMVHSHSRRDGTSSLVATEGDMETAAKYPNARHYMVSRQSQSVVRFTGN